MIEVCRIMAVEGGDHDYEVVTRLNGTEMHLVTVSDMGGVVCRSCSTRQCNGTRLLRALLGDE